MSGYVLDANIISFYLRDDPRVLARLDQVYASNTRLWGCPVVWYEVRRGLLATDAKRQMKVFKDFVDLGVNVENWMRD